MKNRTRLLLACAAAGFVFSACDRAPAPVKTYNQGINIIPRPVSLVQTDGVFRLGKNTVLAPVGPDIRPIADYFAAKINTSTGYELQVDPAAEKKNKIRMQIDRSLDVNDEGYTLEVTPAGVTVAGKTPQGLFYGMQSLMQLLPAEIESPHPVSGTDWTIPCVTVKDEPRFPYRGMMLDPCRHFIPVENVKKYIDVLALFKINRLHWHLTDDQGWRIEIKKYPRLTETGSKRIDGEGTGYGPYFYTQEEIKDVVAYAGERFITVIPEIELPGHELAAIAAYPELSCRQEPITPRVIWGVEDVVMCAGREETFRFLEDVIAEVAPLFPGTYFHIGGDECPKSSWKNCPLCQERIRKEKLKDEHELQSYFVQRMEQVLESYGKRIIGWDEILEGGLAPSATVMSWRGEAGGIAAASMNHDVIMTPGSGGMYIDTYQGDPKIEPVSIGGYVPISKTYAYNPVPDTLVAQGKAGHILGAQCNVWSEYMYTTDLMEYRAFPRILALAELTWTPLSEKDYPDFERRLDNACVRLDSHDIHYHIPQPEQPGGSCNFIAFTDTVSVPFRTTRPVRMVYTTDGNDPTPASATYETPLTFDESTTLKIASVLPSGKMSPVRTVAIEKQPLAPAKETAGTKPGLKMQVAEGMYLRTGDLPETAGWKEKVIRELRELTSQTPVTESMRGVRQYAAVATGYIQIPEDGVYYFSSDNEEVWIDGKLLIDNGGEVKRYSRHDSSVALAAGQHEIKVVFLGHIIGGWPSNWNNGAVRFRKSDASRFSPVTASMLSH